MVYHRGHVSSGLTKKLQFSGSFPTIRFVTSIWAIVNVGYQSKSAPTHSVVLQYGSMLIVAIQLGQACYQSPVWSMGQPVQTASRGAAPMHSSQTLG
ncbi:MAG: hypothetical protein ACI8Z1_001174 [Candidatus Azotimanducaceae bacterium]|jgi:hypothetical protein